MTGKCEYVAMIRPIKPSAGTEICYIICNEDWDIDSMSEGLYEGFGKLSIILCWFIYSFSYLK